jgi:hypothetical protein
LVKITPKPSATKNKSGLLLFPLPLSGMLDGVGVLDVGLAVVAMESVGMELVVVVPDMVEDGGDFCPYFQGMMQLVFVSTTTRDSSIEILKDDVGLLEDGRVVAFFNYPSIR